MSKFDRIRYNISRLMPKKEHNELNKCKHKYLLNTKDEHIYECEICGCKIYDNVSIGELIKASKEIIKQLETIKMICYQTMTPMELWYAKKYFKMIPLLKNIKMLYKVCQEITEETEAYLKCEKIENDE